LTVVVKYRDSFGWAMSCGLYDYLDGIACGIGDPGLVVEHLEGMWGLGAAAPGTFAAERINLDSGHVPPAVRV
jgi:hypothetical protein